MYYNGYIIICILIGAFLGSFVFHWETIGGRLVYVLGITPYAGTLDSKVLTGSSSSPESQTSASREATVCCG
jgi:copper transporter 1